MNLDEPGFPIPDMPGYVYVFRDVGEHSNEIKVGYSIHPKDRVRQLHSSGTIWPMQVYWLWEVSNMRLAEKAAHAALEAHRINPRREFFEIAPSPHFNLEERHNSETTDAILWELIGDITEAMSILGIEPTWVDPRGDN